MTSYCDYCNSHPEDIFIQRENSDFVEVFNNKVKILKRRNYGIFTLKHLFQCIYLDLNVYRLFATIIHINSSDAICGIVIVEVRKFLRKSS